MKPTRTPRLTLTVSKVERTAIEIAVNLIEKVVAYFQ